MDEHRETALAASVSQHQGHAGETVVTVDPDEEFMGEQEVVDGASEAAVPEKLQDDDQFAEIWYKRWFFKVFPQLRRGV